MNLETTLQHSKDEREKAVGRLDGLMGEGPHTDCPIYAEGWLIGAEAREQDETRAEIEAGIVELALQYAEYVPVGIVDVELGRMIEEQEMKLGRYDEK